MTREPHERLSSWLLVFLGPGSGLRCLDLSPVPHLNHASTGKGRGKSQSYPASKWHVLDKLLPCSMPAWTRDVRELLDSASVPPSVSELPSGGQFVVHVWKMRKDPIEVSCPMCHRQNEDLRRLMGLQIGPDLRDAPGAPQLRLGDGLTFYLRTPSERLHIKSARKRRLKKWLWTREAGSPL